MVDEARQLLSSKDGVSLGQLGCFMLGVRLLYEFLWVIHIFS